MKSSNKQAIVIFIIMFLGLGCYFEKKDHLQQQQYFEEYKSNFEEKIQNNPVCLRQFKEYNEDLKKQWQEDFENKLITIN